jgi:phytoene synthase
MSPELVQGYRRCAQLTREYGTTYYWGAVLLPRPQRKHVYAVYALCRLADDIVDLPDGSSQKPVEGRAATGVSLGSAEAPSVELVDQRLTAFEETFRTALVERGSDDPTLAAIVHTVVTCGIEPECFERFFGAMRMDLTVTRYRTWRALCDYMEGSAAVIGEMMLPVLEPTSPEAKEPARSLGLAFQLTNFLRDVGEDLDRGRVYLPQEDLERFGVDVTLRKATPEWKAFLAYEIERNRALYAYADTGIALLPPRSARCVGTARVLYSRILDRIEAADYDVFSSRARVPTWRKAATAARIMVAGPRTKVAAAQLEGSTGHVTTNAP